MRAYARTKPAKMLDFRILAGLFLALAVLPFSEAQSPATLAELKKLPTCALACLTTAVVASPCTFANETCICSNAALQSEVELCVTANCTIPEAFSTKNTTSTICNVPVRNAQFTFTTTSTTLAAVSGLFIVLRFSFKLFIAKTALKADDWLILITMLVGVPDSVINVHGTTANGLGRDVWTLSPDNITAFGRFFFASEILYFTEVSLLKLSLLLFYLRVFPGPSVRRLLWATVAVDVAIGVVFVLLAVFQCWPIDFFWTRWDGQHRGKCLDNNAVAWANAGISIALDIWMLAVPMHQLRGLKLHWKKKVGVGMMFSVGACVTVVSFLRLQSLVSFANSTNPTWDDWNVFNWSIIEINLGIICACMPTVRLILVRIFPALGGSTMHTYGSGMSIGPPSYSGWDGTGGAVRHTASAVGGGNGIVGKKPYTVRHVALRGDDQTSLVRMNDFEGAGSTRSKMSV